MQLEELIKLSNMNLTNTPNNTGKNIVGNLTISTTLRLISNDEPIKFHKIHAGESVHLFYHYGEAVAVHAHYESRENAIYTLGNEIEKRGTFSVVIEGECSLGICMKEDIKDSLAVFSYMLIKN